MSNSDVSIVVEGLGKRYLLPQRARPEGGGRLRSHLKEFLPGLVADREEDYFWALRDVSFEVKRGEILGIVGRNGSGKSTLLKILSGVSQPTTGRAVLRGNVGSLLEVGTGFHPDLSGRENVFMAGALLGLRQSDIRARFDEIVDFAGIGKFIDVPVKRYSSGMYVRLAYAVASMLQSDILILDEVMAVGDAEFREKSQKNIERVANDGRTVLFVSHNAKAVRSICNTGIILDGGKCVFEGTADATVARYMRSVHSLDRAASAVEPPWHDVTDAPRLYDNPCRVLRWVSTHDGEGNPTTVFRTGQPLVVRIGYAGATLPNTYFSVLLMNEFAERVATLHSTHCGSPEPLASEGAVECRVDDLRLGSGDYYVMVDYGTCRGPRETMVSLDTVPNAGRFSVELAGWVGGIGIDSYQGAAMRSRWQCCVGVR